MNNENLYKTIPLELAMEYYADAAKRAREGGKLEERQRIVKFLREHGYHEAAFALTHAKQNA